MPSFKAFDCYSYPGDAVCAALSAAGFTIAGIYLSHSAAGRDASWIAAAPKLASQGWGLIPLYLGAQTVDNKGNRLSPSADPLGQGAADAATAIQRAQSAGFAPGTTIFFDIEDGTPPTGDYEQYLLAWAKNLTGFTPAFYCSHNLIAWAQANQFQVWCFHLQQSGGTLDPAALPEDPIDPGALGTQSRQNVALTGIQTAPGHDLVIDYSVFSIANPANLAATS